MFTIFLNLTNEADFNTKYGKCQAEILLTFHSHTEKFLSKYIR